MKSGDGLPVECWVCKSSDTVPLWESAIERPLEHSDVLITDQRYGVTLSLRSCRNCGFTFAHPLPHGGVIELYENMQDPSYLASLEPRAIEMRSLLKHALERLPIAKTVLDVGAGVGLLVRAAQERGLRAQGVEPSKWLVQQAKEIFGLSLLAGTITHPDVSNQKFDIVFAVDVIEHVPNPVHLLTAIKSCMREQGIAVVTTPDRGSVLAKLMGRKWWHYRLAHIGYFDKRSFSEAVRQSAMVIERFDRQTWYLPLSYLLERLSQYLAVGWAMKFAQRSQRVANLALPLNLRDHLVVTLSKERDYS